MGLIVIVILFAAFVVFGIIGIIVAILGRDAPDATQQMKDQAIDHAYHVRTQWWNKH